ncbi:MAG: CDP-diacylglycerol---glycerol-3-phosphate 3-phosphatidyltransferase, partial [Propionibacteriaceae bacterium]|nr:CDP-diacylglycerol---glycerol-3-phosphate 3-phosphatidyltransferase [Propionibacteriaceae bacterium]
ERFRVRWAKILTPIARFLLRHGVSPDLVTVIGTAGVVVGALLCFPLGWLWQGVLVVTLFVFSDMIDGQMAKMSGRASLWGAFLDSSLDRFGDAAVFGGLLLWFAGPRDSVLWAGVTLAALVVGQLTSYVKARAESLGFTCRGGLAARADRLLLILVGAMLAGLGVPYVLEIAVSALALGGVITVGQRIAQVYRQSKAEDVQPA